MHAELPLNKPLVNSRLWHSANLPASPLYVRIRGECVAKLLLRLGMNRDSVGMTQRIAGAVHDGSARGWTGSILLCV
jgi:hypothetical protein